MKCPYCEEETRVVDSRDTHDGTSVRRRRECVACERRFTTYERAVLDGLQVRKRDGSVEPFQREKIAAGIYRAFEKRPVTEARLETLVEEIEEEIRSLGQAVVDSALIGEHVCEHVRGVDEVAYLRFASVYKEFSEASQFVRELNLMKNER